MNVLRKKAFRLTALTLCLLSLCAPLLALSGPEVRAEDAPAAESAAALLVDLDEDQVLYAKGERDTRAPASMVKIMTVLLGIEAYERGDVALTDLVDVTEDAFFDVGSGDNSGAFSPGEQVPFEALLYSVMLTSGNEACNAIAQRVSGSVVSFVAAMNARAIELGCTGTNFANTHGLPNEHSYSTAYDLYLITSAAWKHNLFKRLCSTESYAIPDTNLNPSRVIRNGNSLLNAQSAYFYEYASGVKTGYTDAAGYCAIATASKDGRTLLSVVLGAQSYTAEDGRTMVQSFSDTKNLMNWGFDNFVYTDLLSTLKLIDEVPVKLGLGVSSVVLRPEEKITALLPRDADLSQVELHHTLLSDEPLVAPVEEGRVMGEVSVTFQGRDYGSVRLVTNTAVELDRAAYIGSEIRSTLRNKYVRLAITVLVVLIILYIAFIIYYNIRRANKRRVAADLARRRVQEYRRGQNVPEEPAPAAPRPESVSVRAASDVPRRDDTVRQDSAAPRDAVPQTRPQRPAETTTGLTFEEIEAIFRKRDQETRKK